jgi:FkbM family methyltransferase
MKFGGHKKFFELMRLTLRNLGYEVVKSSTLESLLTEIDQTSEIRSKLAFFEEIVSSTFCDDKKMLVLKNFENSYAQLKQDLIALFFSKDGPGYFVEFGATDGKTLSNTYLLEKRFGWRGILAEPATSWHKDLMANRNVHINTECVWKVSGQILSFMETDSRELSTIAKFSSHDSHGEDRKVNLQYEVMSISLLDLLDLYEAPRYIEYLSIDTEGSEFEILNAFDFSQYTFGLITCEHNFSANRDRVYDLLTKNGYQRVMMGISKFDDWYVKLNLVEA